MIAHWNIIQGSEAWHEIKYGRIGGSTSKGLFVKTDTLLDEILSAHLEPFELEDDDFESDAMMRGNDLEPHFRAQLSQYAGVEFKQCGWLQCEELDILGISPDGITEDLRDACEIKCPGRKKHTTTIREGITPIDHLHQIVHYFTVNPLLERLHFASGRPESIKPLFVTVTTRNTLVNLGTKAKPVVKPVHEWVDLAKIEAKIIADTVALEVKKLNGI